MKFFLLILNRIKKNCFYLFITSFILLRLPPLVFPLLNNSILNSHSIARYLLLIIVFANLDSKKSSALKGLGPFMVFLSIYLLANTFSIIRAVSIYPFLMTYKNILFGIIFFYNALLIINNLNKFKFFVRVLIMTYIINLFILIVIVFLPELYLEFSKYFIYYKYSDDFLLHLQRGRFFSDIVDFSLIAFILFPLFHEKSTRERFIYLLLLLLNIFLVSISGYRTNLVQLTFSLLLFFAIFKKARLRLIILLLSFSLLVTVPSVIKVSPSYEYQTINRLLSPDKYDISTITSRLDYWSKAIQMGLASPIIGVGLNNYYDYYYPKHILTGSLLNPRNDFFESTTSHPHNIFFVTFAETGIIGLVSLSILIAYFFYFDFVLVKKNTLLWLFIISFWSLFTYALITSVSAIPQYITLFWALRAIIFVSYYNNFQEKVI